VLGECISGAVFVTRSIVDLVVVVHEQLQPTHLPLVQDSRFREVLQILMIGEDLDREMSPLEPVAPVLKTFYDRESFLVGDPVIPLCQVHGLQHKTNRVVSTVSLFLGKDSAIGIIRGISLQAELRVGIHMDQDGGLRNAPLQKFEGVLFILGPLPHLVLLE